jgi:hypothetical protein
MGISSDIMHDFVAKEIRSIYSSYDGWKMTDSTIGSGYDRIVVLERRTNGHQECTRMLVTFSKDVKPAALEELKRTVRNPDGTLSRNMFAIMMPANANTASVPEGITVYSMRSFSFDGKELAWMKKPVRKSEGAPVNVPA